MTKPSTTSTPPDALSIWCVTDDKPGHRNQLLGLVSALSALTPTNLYWYSENHDSTLTPAEPDLILASGRPTQIVSLWVKWRYGGKLAVMGNPSLPKVLFDRCIIPEHDGVAESAHVITTKGAMNKVVPSPTKIEGGDQQGLILIGGEAKYYQWNDGDMAKQLVALKASLPDIHWTLTTSRRTPESFLKDIAGLADDHFEIVPFVDTTPDWLMTQYQRCGTIWASEDSVSMVYESLSAGAAVGILSVPRLQTGRVSRGLDQLITEQRVTTLDDLTRSGKMRDKRPPLQEARRVAVNLLDWLGVKVDANALAGR